MGKTKIEWEFLVKRFCNNIQVNSFLDCWLWTAGKFSSGYGQFRDGKKKLIAHRDTHIQKKIHIFIRIVEIAEFVAGQMVEKVTGKRKAN